MLYAVAAILIGGGHLTNVLLSPQSTAVTQPYLIELNLRPEAVDNLVDPSRQAFGLIASYNWFVSPAGLVGLFIALIGVWFTVAFVGEIRRSHKRCAN